MQWDTITHDVEFEGPGFQVVTKRDLKEEEEMMEDCCGFIVPHSFVFMAYYILIYIIKSLVTTLHTLINQINIQCNLIKW